MHTQRRAAMATPSAVLAIVRAARPHFRHRADALVFALHAALLAEGLVLVAVGDAAAAEPPRTGAPLPEAGHDGWNAAPDDYAFRYRQDGAAAAHGTVVLKALVAGNKLFVDAAPPSPGAAAHVELRRARARVRAMSSHAPRSARRLQLRSFADTACLCALCVRSNDEYTTDNLSGGAAEAYANLDGLLARVRSALLPSLLPAASAARGAEGAGAAAQPGERAPRQPAAAEPYGSGYGGAWCVACLPACEADAEKRCHVAHSGGGGMLCATAADNWCCWRRRGGVPARHAGPLSVGEQDLYPPGMPYLPPLGPMVPPGGHGGGMLVGPDHPVFSPFGGGGVGPGHPPQLPQGVPPGARFDPYGACTPACGLADAHTHACALSCLNKRAAPACGRTHNALLSCLNALLAIVCCGTGPPGVPGFEPDRFGGERGRGGPVLPGQPRPVHPDVMQLGGDDVRDVRPFG
jgi:hypothetical protein